MNTLESVLMRWMKLEPIIQSEVNQKEKHQYSILTHMEFRKMVAITLYARQQKRHMYPNVHRSTVYNSQDMEAT